jgi:toxin ParE1/3/4
VANRSRDQAGDTRELVITRTPYIAPYRIEGDVVRILRVIHGAQIWPDEISDEI